MEESLEVMLPCTSAADLTSDVELDFDVSSVSFELPEEALPEELRSDA